MVNLREYLNLPVINGELIVSPKWVFVKPPTQGILSQIFFGEKKIQKQVYEWEIKFIFYGPDGRYNPGICAICNNSIDAFLETLNKAHVKMIALEKQSFLGEYRESFYVIRNNMISIRQLPGIEIVARNGNIALEISASSKTYRFKKRLDSNQVKSVLSELSNAKERAEKLIESLRSLNS